MEISVDTWRSARDRIRDRALAKTPDSLVDALRSVREADVFVYAGSLAFYALVSAVPLAVVAFWLVGSAVGTHNIDRVVDSMASAAPAGEAAKPVIDRLLRTSTAVGVGAVIAALWPATSYGAGLGRAFARMTDTDDGPAPGLRGRAKALLLVVLLPALLAGALGLAYVAPGLFGSGLLATAAGWAVGAVAAVAVTAGFLAIVFAVFGPNHLSGRSIAIAAVIGAVATTVLSMAFAVYAAHGADWQRRAAGSSVGVVVLFALWLYLANAVLVIAYRGARALDGKLSGQPSR